MFNITTYIRHYDTTHDDWALFVNVLSVTGMLRELFQPFWGYQLTHSFDCRGHCFCSNRIPVPGKLHRDSE